METKPVLELPEKTTFSMEVEYTYQADKDAEVQTSWYYHWVETDNLKKAITAAKKHFMEMVKSTNWTTKVKVLSIHEMQNDKSKADVMTVSPTELAPARTKGTTRKSPTATSKPRAPRKPRATTTKPNPLPL